METKKWLPWDLWTFWDLSLLAMLQLVRDSSKTLCRIYLTTHLLKYINFHGSINHQTMQVRSRAVLSILVLVVKQRCQILWWPLQWSYPWNCSQGYCITLPLQSLLQSFFLLYLDSLTFMKHTISGKLISWISLLALGPSLESYLLPWRSVS